jgi:hypothetical protein
MEPSEGELGKAICNLETNKARGEDQITAERIGNTSREIKEKRHYLYIKIHYTACFITIH